MVVIDAPSSTTDRPSLIAQVCSKPADTWAIPHGGRGCVRRRCVLIQKRRLLPAVLGGGHVCKSQKRWRAVGHTGDGASAAVVCYGPPPFRPAA